MKKILTKIIIMLWILLNFSLNTFSYINKDKDMDMILIITSYSNSNSWENSVIHGIEQYRDNHYKIKIEYLDSKSNQDPNYADSFLKLLNLKYKDNNIKCVITIDDEAFDLVRKNIFNSDCFLYKMQVLFVGVNSVINLSSEEEYLMTGIMEQQDNLEMLDTIMNINKNLENLYVLSDNSIYSRYNNENIKEIEKKKLYPLNVNIIKGTYLSDIEPLLKSIDKHKSAIYIYGTFKDKNNNYLSEAEIIENIKEITHSPIYTKLESYVTAGAIGGIVNDGNRIGQITGKVLSRLLITSENSIIVPAFEMVNIPMFNFKAVRQYNINPLKLPPNTIYINKGAFDLLIPKWAEILIWVIIFSIFFSIIFLIYRLNYNKQKVKEHNRLLIEAEERNKIKTDFILTVSHELRTPLNIIINLIKLLKIKIDEGKYDEDDFKNKLNIAAKNSNRLLRYVNNLIDVSKFELGYFDLKLRNENIVYIVEEVTLSVIDLAKKYNIEIIFDTEEEEIIMAIDKEKIERVILNLLSNAIKFSRKNGKILVLVLRKNSNVIIKVADNGIGIKAELQKNIFDKFKREEAVSNLNVSREGSGLGLYIVKSIIQQHKGTVELISKQNVGSIFTITIPITHLKDEKQKNNISVNSLKDIAKLELSDL